MALTGCRLPQKPPQKRDRPRPRLLRGLEVRAISVLLLAQEAVPRAGVRVGLEASPQLLERGGRRFDGGVDSLVVASEVAEHRGTHREQRGAVGSHAVEHHRRHGRWIGSRVLEASGTAPAEAEGCHLAVGRGNLRGVAPEGRATSTNSPCRGELSSADLAVVSEAGSRGVRAGVEAAPSTEPGENAAARTSDATAAIGVMARMANLLGRS